MGAPPPTLPPPEVSSSGGTFGITDLRIRRQDLFPLLGADAASQRLAILLSSPKWCVWRRPRARLPGTFGVSPPLGGRVPYGHALPPAHRGAWPPQDFRVPRPPTSGRVRPAWVVVAVP
eukprot:gene20817-biopygen7076